MRREGEVGRTEDRVVAGRSSMPFATKRKCEVFLLFNSFELNSGWLAKNLEKAELIINGVEQRIQYVLTRRITVEGDLK